MAMTPTRRKMRNLILRVLLAVLVIAAAAAGGWSRWVYVQIESYANQDQAEPSDAIGVFGAAEYDGRPSPVYRARLDHAFQLYNRGIAPLMITLGGDGGDDFSGGRRRAGHLIGKGVPGAVDHRRDAKPEYGRIGAPHCGDCADQRTEAVGDCERRNALVPNP